MEARDARKMTYEAYVALVASSDVRFEYVNDEAFAMAGGTPRHSKICANVGGALWAALRGKRCQAYQSDLRVRVETTGLATYPDVTVVCGPIEPSKRDAHAATNPRAIVEVTSDSTEGYDRGAKFHHYQAMPSLSDYVVVSGDRVQVDHYHRQDDGTWLLRSIGPSPAAVTLVAIDASLSLGDIYAQLDEAPAA